MEMRNEMKCAKRASLDKQLWPQVCNHCFVDPFFPRLKACSSSDGEMSSFYIRSQPRYLGNKKIFFYFICLSEKDIFHVPFET